MSGFQRASIGVDQFLSVRIALTPDSATPFELFLVVVLGLVDLPTIQARFCGGDRGMSGIRKEKGLLELLYLQGIDDSRRIWAKPFVLNSFIIHGWNPGQDVPGWLVHFGRDFRRRRGGGQQGHENDSSAVLFFSLFCRFFFFPTSLLSWNGRTIWPHVFFMCMLPMV